MTDKPTTISDSLGLSPESRTVFMLIAAICVLCLIVCFTACCFTIFCLVIRKFQKRKRERQAQDFVAGEEADPFMASNSYSDDDDDVEPLSLNRTVVEPSAPSLPFAEPNVEQNRQISFFGRFSN